MIKEVKENKFLGVEIDEKITFFKHADTTITTIKKGRYAR